MELKTAIRQIQSGSIAPVYLLQGDDYYLQQFIVDQIESEFSAGEKLQRQLLLPDEFGSREIIDALRHTDLFSSRKIFILRNAQKIKQPYRQQLIDYCNQPIPNHCLVIIDDEFGSQKSIYRNIAKKVEAINTRKPFESELRKWAKYFFHEKQIQADREIVDTVLGIAGDSVYHIANEIEKICLGIEPGTALNMDMVSQFSGWRREHRQWEFLLAVAGRKLGQSQVLGRALLAQGISLISLVYQLSTLYSELLYLKISGGTSAPVSGYIPLPPSVRKRLGGFSKKYSYEEIDLALELLVAIDRRIKSTVTTDESELAIFLFRALGENE